jgi:hypothetical protein
VYIWKLNPIVYAEPKSNKGGMKATKIEWRESGIIGVNSGVASGGVARTATDGFAMKHLEAPLPLHF